MKKCIALILALLMLFSLPGCSGQEDRGESAVSFYYLRDPENYVYGSADGVVTFELREGDPDTVGAAYLLTLYLQGPLDDSLRSPFPAGCRISNLTRKDNEVTILLNSNFSTLKGLDQTLACVCLARTCMSITGAQSVHIRAESFGGQVISIETITEDFLLPGDDPAPD